MKLVVKPNKIKNINKIKADAFIFGMENFCVNPTSIVNLEELKQIKESINDKEIFISMDKNIFNEEIDDLKNILKEIDKLNISGILFYDICFLSLQKELNLKTPLIWNQNFFVTNYETLNFYKRINIKGAVITTEITIDEVSEIANKHKDILLFVNAFGYQMMSFSKRKLISNYYNHINKKDFIKKHYLLDKNNKYRIIEYDNGTAILSSNILNTIKEFNTYKKIGIDYLILDEKEIKRKDFIYVLDIFNDCKNNDKTEEELNKYDYEIQKHLNTDTGFLYKKTIYRVKK